MFHGLSVRGSFLAIRDHFFLLSTYGAGILPTVNMSAVAVADAYSLLSSSAVSEVNGREAVVGSLHSIFLRGSLYSVAVFIISKNGHIPFRTEVKM